MFPLGHAAVGLLVYAVARFHRNLSNRSRGGAVALAALLVGTQFPDMIDKPLAYWGVLPSGRTLAHSLVTTIPFLVFTALVGKRIRRSVLTNAFGIGVVSHLVADSSHGLVTMDWASVRYLLWPLTQPVTYATEAAPWSRLAAFYLQPQLRLEFGLVLVSVSVWALLLRRRAANPHE